MAFICVLVDSYRIGYYWKEHPCQFFYVIPRNFFKRKCGGSIPLEWDEVREPVEKYLAIDVHFKNSKILTIPLGKLSTTKPPQDFIVSSTPPDPKMSTFIRLQIKFKKDQNESKFCFVLVLLFIILLSSLCLTASLIFKFYVEKERTK